MIQQRLEAAGFNGKANIDSLSGYIDLLTKWNRKINLTALGLDPLSAEAVDRLIVEPVKAAELVEKPAASVIDLGSGGGSPAIPFRIQLPGSKMRMVESRSRKCAFLREAARHLALAEISVEECRFEELRDRKHLKGSADIVTMRAVRLDLDLIELIRWLLVPGGLVFRFASLTEDVLDPGLQLVASHVLVQSKDSQLQIAKLRA